MRSGPREGLDAVLHNMIRLQALAFLSGCKEAEFSAVRDHCGVSDPTLSKAVAALESAGYLRVKKGYVGKFPRTWLAVTPTGRTALSAYLAALDTIVSSAQEAGAAAERALP
jgi:DNA-binding MarR family transcriptional regulator